MNSKQVKTFIRQKLGLSVVVRTIGSSYIEARIRPNPSSTCWDLTYPAEFPAAFRQLALAAVYGSASSLAQQTYGGNVQQHSICISPAQWDALEAACPLGVQPWALIQK